ncbi:MAG: hypothetical protein JNN13_07195 [Planctomycetes bacterium]|nr:hypothetical protein [Planctomycetota bacterium]
MLFTRKLGSILRGKATPLQVSLATTLGGLLGFVPGFFLPGDLGGGFAQAPGLILLLLCAALVLNANLGVFGLTTLLAKLLSFVLLPVSYWLGGVLLDGPLQGLFRGLVNGKVTAWFGLEYYATTGGLLLGLVFGVGSGWLLNRGLRLLRARMAEVEANSERYQKYANKGWVRFSTWLLLGKGKGKQTWRELSESQKRGLPIRISGVIVAVVFLASIYTFQTFFSTPILTRNLKAGLEAVNGATVDLQAARLGLGDGNLSIEGLAIADKNALDRDLFAADKLVATIDTGELLRKRLVIAEIVASNARGNLERAERGVRITGTAPPPPPSPAPAGSKTIDDYVKDYELWRQRLEQAKQWIEKIAGGDQAPAPQPTPEEIAAKKAAQEAAGLARVVATHLLEATPRVVIKKLDIEGIRYSLQGKVDALDLHAQNLSDAPSLLQDLLQVSLKSQSDSLLLALTGRSATTNQLGLDFVLKQVPVDSVFGQLRLAGAAPLQGGTMDLSLKALLDQVQGQGLSLDAPLQVALKDTMFQLAGATPTKVQSLLLPIGLRGPLANPAVSLDDRTLQKALLDAGQQELAGFVQGQAGKLLQGLPTDLKGVVDPSQSPEQMLDAAKQKAAAEQKRLEEEVKQKAEEARKKLLPGGLQGLIPGGKKN